MPRTGAVPPRASCCVDQREDLKDTIDVARQMYGSAAEWKDKEKQFRFRNGAVFHMAYLESDADAMNYQGWSLTRVYVEELTQYASSAGIFRLFATLRTTSGARCQFRATCNPGGPGHHWVKSWVIDNGAYRPIKDAETGLIRIFIPAKISDNPSLLNNDPNYINRLRASGSPALVRAWLDGDWNIIEGAFFPEFDPLRHVITPPRIPLHWTRFRTMDWGSASPFSLGWWAVVQDDMIHDKRRLPKNAIIRYREWYGASGPNKGLKLPADAVAKEVVRRETDGKGFREPIAYGILDPSPHFKSCRVRALVRRLQDTAFTSGVPTTRVSLRQNGWVVGIRFDGDFVETKTATP